MKLSELREEARYRRSPAGRADQAARVAALHARHACLLEGLTDRLYRIATLHAPDERGDCKGCEAVLDTPLWPCDTALILLGEDQP